MTGPLDDISVVDFSWVGAGAYTTRILADLGANVTRVESNTRIDQIRLTPPFKDMKPGVNRSGYFADRNAGKRSITVNLKHPEGLALVLDMIENAQLVANNFAPGTMERLGLGYDDVRRRRPDVIYLEMSMQGRDGPHADHVGYGLTIGALSGLHHMTGAPGQPPIGTGTNYPDHVPSPGHAAFAVLSAIHHWRRTGEGQRVELSQTEATVASLGTALLAESVGVEQAPSDNLDRTALLHDTFRTAGSDTWVTISIYSEDQWQRLQSVLELEEMADLHWAFGAQNAAERAQVRDWIESATARWQASTLVDRLQQVGVAAAVVATAQDVVDLDPQLRYREHWLTLPHPEVGSFLYNALPIRASMFDVKPPFGAPLLGEHTDQALSEAGLDAERIAALRADGALE